MIELMHAQDADLDDLEQYVGWWQQEKYRGVRMYWDGYAAWTRQGQEIELPADWYESMPDIELDCEIYDGIYGERRCASAARFGPKHITPTMRIIAFDAPMDDCTPWEERMMTARMAVEGADFDRFEYAPWSKVKSLDHLLQSLAEVHSRGGEGLMLRKPGMLYTPGRPQGFVKMKHSV